MHQNAEVDAHGEDPRVRRTRKLLQDGFIELMEERSFEAITVGEIATAASVNRATFYRHYRDKYHLVEGLFTEALNAMLGVIGPPESHVAENRPGEVEFQQAWTFLFRHIADNERLYRALLSVGGEPSFRRRIHEQIVVIIKSRVQKGVWLSQRGLGLRIMKMPESDILFDFVANLLLGTIAWWLEEGRNYTADQIAEWTRKFLRKGFNGLLAE